MAQISDSQLDKLRAVAKCDHELLLSDQIIRGWPENVKSVPKPIRCYWSMRDYISVEDGLFYTGQ